MSPRRDKIMSDALKEELAEELGRCRYSRREGWAAYHPGTVEIWLNWQ